MESFREVVSYVFKEEELGEPEYDKSLSENGLDSLGIISFLMFLHDTFKMLDQTVYDDVDLTKTSLIELEKIFYAGFN